MNQARFTVSAAHTGRVLSLGVEFAVVEHLLSHTGYFRRDAFIALARTLDVGDVEVFDAYRIARVA